jgi:trimeric autotransporter adhesin
LPVKQNASLLLLTGWQIVNKFFTPNCSLGATMKVHLTLVKLTQTKHCMTKLFTLKFLVVACLGMLLQFEVMSQVTMATTGSHTQNFNTLASTGTVITFTDNSTISNWYSQRTGTGTTYNADAGSGNAGLLYSYGSAASVERALGTIGSGNAAAGSFAHGVLLRNTSGTTITDIKVGYTLEQWRNAAAAAQPITVYYKISSSPITALTPNVNATWTQVAGLTLNSPITGGTAEALDGNLAANKVSVANIAIPSLSLANNEYIMIKWEDPDHSGTDHGLSIDDVNVAWTVTPVVSSNADLSNLALSAGTLAPAFAAATTSYTASVANAVTSITLTPTAADINSTITVNGNAVTSGNPSGGIALSVGANIITTVVTAQDAVTTKTYTVTVTRAAAGTATLTQTASLANFGNVCINTSAGPNSFTIDGSDLDGSNIAVAALSGFTYSETAGGTYTTTLNFSYTGNAFNNKIIHVKFDPLAVQSYNGNIVLSGGGVTSFNVAAAGAGVNTATVVTTGSSTVITATSATTAGAITVTGCSTVSAYGIEYSLTSGFVNGTGTQVPSTNLAAGNFSSNLTGLTPNARIYYKAYVTDGSGTVWGAQQAFNCLPLAVPMASQPGLTFTEPFSDIANWSDFFITGTGANHWDGLSTNGTTPIPSAPILTTQTNTFQTPSSPGANVAAGGVQKGTDQLPAPGTQSIVLLSTGTTNNTTSAAIDLWVDFTGVNAGTLSFDYTTIQNNLIGSGDNRPGSLRVYGSPDKGVTFTEITNVLNFTNNLVLSDSKTNVPLPVSFNNNANSLIRFYYYNGETGGTTGSRPKIAIDNVKITALANTPCAAPTAPATALTFGTITDVSIQGSFTAASPASDNYIVVISTSSSLTGSPINGQTYSIGDNLGDGTVIANGVATSFTATGLTALTTYYFFVFPVNAVCTGGPLYYGTSLNGSATTVAGLPACAAPAAQPASLILNSPPPTINTIQGSFTATTADEYLVLRSTSSTLSNNPVNAQVYNAGDILGNAVVVQRSTATTFTATGLSPATQYYFFVFSLNSQACVNGPVYNTVLPLTSTETTQPLPACVAPLAQPSALILTAANTSVSGTFTGIPSADTYLVVRSLSPTLSATPVDNTDYNAGDAFGGGIVVANSSATSFLATGLTINTTYYFYVFAANKNCSGGTKYATAAPLTANVVTTNVLANNVYFGTLHAHSDYSDGNKDNPGYTPAQDYAYAKTALCMDYLGISEHNHYSGGDPGNLLSNYHQGTAQANAYSSANPDFLAMYGMEWGTISGGGHVLVYGNGMDNLWGWESGSGAWGASNNYDTYVPKSVYTSSTGLFKTVNDNVATNTFASLAHPNLSDFNNLANIAYDAVADSAISATTVESGPSSSTNTTYTNPASSMSYLWYYQMLLSKGYHLGPTIDHDNHYTTFGKTTFSRTAIIAPNLTKAAITNALRKMNFYATQDCDTKVDFTINTRIMGSVFTDRFAPNIAVTLTDATTSTAGAIIRLMHGVPGSGTLPVKIDSAIGSTLTFTHSSLANLATGYYYIDITNGSSRVVTSPIWYTRSDAAGGPLPVKLNSFVVQKINTSAKITWSTDQEINSSHFVIERSTDGRTWNAIATVAAAGYSSTRTNYNTYDNMPMKGMNYYRLKQVDKDAKYEYSDIQKALFNSTYTAEVIPNPATNFINLFIAKTGSQQATVQLLNANGKIVYSTLSAQSYLQIKTAGMSKGLYFVKVVDADNTTTIKVLVQ